MATLGSLEENPKMVTLSSFTSRTRHRAAGVSHIELGEFLRGSKGPEQQALLRLIGQLLEVPPFASDTETGSRLKT
jgi:hypothetical protein